MAGRSKPTATATVETEQVEATETEQVDTTPEQVEATEQAADQAEAGEVESEDQRNAMNEFVEAVAEALEQADTSTGDLGAQYMERVSRAFHGLDGQKAKNAAKRYLDDKMAESLDADDLVRAKVCMKLRDKGTAAAKAAPRERIQLDPAQAFADKVTTLRVAEAFAETEVPEGANDWGSKVGNTTDLAAQATKFAAWLDAEGDDKGEEPDVSIIAKNAVRMARGRAVRTATRTGSGAGTRTSLRRDIAAHIVNAFTDKPSGTFLTVAEITNTKSAEYGDESPSQGAVSVRLFPTSGKPTTVPGVIPGRNEKGVRGATKA